MLILGWLIRSICFSFYLIIAVHRFLFEHFKHFPGLYTHSTFPSVPLIMDVERRVWNAVQVTRHVLQQRETRGPAALFSSASELGCSSTVFFKQRHVCGGEG
jgi:hypothetical protein